MSLRQNGHVQKKVSLITTFATAKVNAYLLMKVKKRRKRRKIKNLAIRATSEIR